MRRAADARAGAAVLVDVDATVTLRFAVFDDAPDLLRLAQLSGTERRWGRWRGRGARQRRPGRGGLGTVARG